MTGAGEFMPALHLANSQDFAAAFPPIELAPGETLHCHAIEQSIGVALAVLDDGGAFDCGRCGARVEILCRWPSAGLGDRLRRFARHHVSEHGRAAGRFRRALAERVPK